MSIPAVLVRRPYGGQFDDTFDTERGRLMHSASMGATLPRATSYADERTTRTLLTCGTLAGPVFVVVGLIQAFTIPGFDLTHHYLSQLSSGELGWIQIA